jgi:hypothetical protein
MNTFMSKLAEVFDALGSAVDAQGLPPAASSKPDPLIAAVENRTGTKLSSSTQQKIASDPEMRQAMESLVASPEAPRSLGAPAEKAASSTPTTKAERRQHAENEFARRVMGGTNN